MKKKLYLLIISFALVFGVIQHVTFANQETGRNLETVFPDLNILSNGELFDIDGNPIDTITQQQQFLLKFDWLLTNEQSPLIQDGDYFEFALPSILKINQDILNQPLGDRGYFSAYTDGTIRVTFNDLVKDESENQGSFYISAQLNDDDVKEPGIIIVTLPVKESVQYELILKPSQQFQAIEKQGAPNRAKNADIITWNVYINRNYDTLNDVVVTDLIPDGLSVMDIRVFDVSTDLSGTITEEDTPTQHAYTLDNTELHFGTISTPYRIQITTTLDEAAIPVPGTPKTFKNIAVLESSDLGAVSSDAEVAIVYGELLNKASGSYQADKRSISWKITYNAGELSLLNPQIIDTLDSRVYLDESSFVIKSAAKTYVKDVDYTLTLSGDQFIVDFIGVLNEEVTLDYITKIKNDVIVTETTRFTNSASSQDSTKEATINIGQALLRKRATGINYADQNMSWRFDINQSRDTLANLQLTDTFKTSGLTFIESSLVVHNMSANTRLIRDTDYTLEVLENGYILRFINDYALTSDQLSVSFTTDYDLGSLRTHNGNFINHGSLHFTDINGQERTIESEASQQVNRETYNNGLKFGSYNATAKTITWNIATNYDRITHMTSSLTDTIESGQTFVPQSLKIVPYTVLANGTLSYDPEAVIDLTQVNIIYPSLENDQTLFVDLSSLDPSVQYLVSFETSVADTLIQGRYTNTAVYKNDSTEYPLSASVEVKHGDTVLTKEGKQDGEFIDWRLNLNFSQSRLQNVVISDTPSENQIIVQDSFVIYGTHVNETGDVTIDETRTLVKDIDYEVSISEENGKETFTLKLLNEINEAYIIGYKTLVAGSPGSNTVSNDAFISGDNISETQIPVNTSQQFVVTLIGGSGSGKTGSYTIQKVDDAGNPLAGVHFELRHKTTNSLLKSESTDASGIIHFTRLIYGDYILTESAPLTGYIIDEALQEGINVTINDASSNQDFLHTLVNHRNEVTLHKIDVHHTLLDGSVFNLEVKTDLGYVSYEDNLTAANGIVSVRALPEGDYRFIEIQADGNYILNQEPIAFSVASNQAETIVLEHTNYQGSVVLEKTNDAGQPLEGVTYALYQGETLILDTLTTDAEGKISLDTLSPGNYTFKETASVDGYILDETPLNFVIDTHSFGAPETVYVSAVNRKGSASLKKVDDAGNPLAGVRFQLIAVDDPDTEAVEYTTDESGVLYFENLKSGRYEIQETASLSGYILNTQTFSFTIPHKQVSDIDGAVQTHIDLGNIVNHQGGIIVRKTDAAGNLLKEAVFELYQDDVLVTTQTTIEGRLAFSQLAPGTYTLKESEAPEGYVLSTESYTFEIPESFAGDYVYETIDIINESIEPLTSEPVNNIGKLPQTGLGSLSNALLFGALFIASGSLCFALSIRRKRKYS